MTQEKNIKINKPKVGKFVIIPADKIKAERSSAYKYMF